MRDLRALIGALAIGLVLLLQAASVSPTFAQADGSFVESLSPSLEPTDGGEPVTDSAPTLPDVPAVPVQRAFVVHIVNHGTDGAQATFDPPTIIVPQGARVTWVNDDLLAQHSPTADAAAWDSQYLSAGQSWTRGFDAPGTFGYICPVHWIMRGSVKVEAAPAATIPVTAPSDNSEWRP